MPSIPESRKRALGERLQAHRISDTEFRVYNVSKGTSYSVTRSAVGIWRCECPFMTKGSHVGTTQGVCKHLTRVYDKLRGCGGGTPGNYCRAGKLCASCTYEEKMRL